MGFFSWIKKKKEQIDGVNAKIDAWNLRRLKAKRETLEWRAKRSALKHKEMERIRKAQGVINKERDKSNKIRFAAEKNRLKQSQEINKLRAAALKEQHKAAQLRGNNMFNPFANPPTARTKKKSRHRGSMPDNYDNPWGGF